MKYFENGNVTYLENEDIDDKGNLKFDPKKPAICMVQGLFCGWCSKAKPDFQKFADNHPEIFVCTVQIDGNDSEKQLNSRLSTLINGYRGVPMFFGYDKTGKNIKVHNGGRTEGDMVKFAATL